MSVYISRDSSGSPCSDVSVSSDSSGSPVIPVVDLNVVMLVSPVISMHAVMSVSLYSPVMAVIELMQSCRSVSPMISRRPVTS